MLASRMALSRVARLSRMVTYVPGCPGSLYGTQRIPRSQVRLRVSHWLVFNIALLTILSLRTAQRQPERRRPRRARFGEPLE
jgi:hypothetical protein